MIGAPELVIIAIAAGVFFFGKNQVFDWAKTMGQAKKAFKDGLDEQKEIAESVSEEAGLNLKKKKVSKTKRTEENSEKGRPEKNKSKI
ncbi:MAG: hypothetical protein QGI60_04440 [archaeon]|jgi:Sec-independent protein translocase protein TatA|nr:hypothetical protein [archaeon]